MARLLEFEAKRLFAAAGMPVPGGTPVSAPPEAARVTAALGGEVVVKAQVPVGKRAAAGGIRFATSPAEAESLAAALLGTDMLGFPVEQVLIEPRADIRAEYYLSVFSNPMTRMPIVIFSLTGGSDVENTGGRDSSGIATLDVDIIDGVRIHHALELLRRAGVDRAHLVPLARVVVRLYEVYRRHDCTLAEINPLALTADGVMVLDGRVNVDDDALFRHAEMGIQTSEEVGDRRATPLEEIAGRIDAFDHRGSAHFVQIDPDGSLARETGKVSIGFDGIGTGVSLTTLDELVPLGFLPKNFCDTSGNPTASKLYRITRVILSQPDIEGYVFVSCVSSQQLDNTARGIVKAFKEIYRDTGGAPNLPCVLSFRGAWDETALAMFDAHGITRSPWVRVLGRDTTERDVARVFRDLHAKWAAERGTGTGG